MWQSKKSATVTITLGDVIPWEWNVVILFLNFLNNFLNFKLFFWTLQQRCMHCYEMADLEEDMDAFVL